MSASKTTQAPLPQQAPLSRSLHLPLLNADFADTSGFQSTLSLNQATQDAGWPDWRWGGLKLTDAKLNGPSVPPKKSANGKFVPPFSRVGLVFSTPQTHESMHAKSSAKGAPPPSRDLFHIYKAVNKTGAKTDYETAAQDVAKKHGLDYNVSDKFRRYDGGAIQPRIQAGAEEFETPLRNDFRTIQEDRNNQVTFSISPVTPAQDARQKAFDAFSDA